MPLSVKRLLRGRTWGERDRKGDGKKSMRGREYREDRREEKIYADRGVMTKVVPFLSRIPRSAPGALNFPFFLLR